MPKATSKQGRSRKDGSVFNANHNFKSETREQQNHIDHDRTQNNLYHRYGVDQGWIRESFDAKEYELERYKELYGDGQEAKNARYEKQGHKERCKTIDQVYEGKKTAPQETIWQLDNIKSTMDPQERTKALVASANAVVRDLAKEYGANFIPLDFALHRDEGLVHGEYIGLDHIHFRCTFAVKDKDGHLVPNQTEALRQMGYKLPYPDKPQSRYNNLSISFSDDIRERFYKELEARGIEIDREVKSRSHRQTEIQEYKYQQQLQENQALQEENQALLQSNQALQAENESLKRQMAQIRDLTEEAIEEHQEAIEKRDMAITEAHNQEERALQATKEADLQEARREKNTIEADKEETRALRNAEVAEKFLVKNIKINKKLGTFSMSIALYQGFTAVKQWAENLLNAPIYHPKEIEEYQRKLNQALSMKREYEQLRDDIDQVIEERATEKASFQATIDHNKVKKLEADVARLKADNEYLDAKVEDYEKQLGIETHRSHGRSRG